MQYIGLIGWIILLFILGASINPAWSTILVVVSSAFCGVMSALRQQKKEEEKRRRKEEARRKREEMKRLKLDDNFDPVF